MYLSNYFPHSGICLDCETDRLVAFALQGKILIFIAPTLCGEAQNCLHFFSCEKPMIFKLAWLVQNLIADPKGAERRI